MARCRHDGPVLSDHDPTAIPLRDLADETEVTYLVSEFYTPAAERGVRWNDPAFGIRWPAEPAVISDKDCSWPDFVGERIVATADQE